MRRENVNDYLAFIAVARAQSFTKAAAQLGVSQSAVSHTVRALEQRLGVRLLTRTTRSVAPTEAGERLLATVAPRLDEIDSELAAVSELRDKPAGTIRITTTDYAADLVLWPKLAKMLPRYPLIKIEIAVDYGMSNIVADQFDLGVRWGDQVEKDMVAVRIGPDVQSVIVGAPSYLAKHPVPKTPQDLVNHNCISLRLASGGTYAWELAKGKRRMQVRVDGQLTCNGAYQILHASLSGTGLGFMPADMAQPYIDKGRLQCVLPEWAPTFPGLHLYYASRRETSRALAVVIEALRYRAA